jgi:hypothetical protein
VVAAAAELGQDRRMARLLALAVVLAGIATFADTSTAEAQGRRGGRQPRVIQLEEIRIEGRVQKPNAFYILNRSSIGYEVLDLRTSFTREVVRSVQSEPF